MEQIAPGRVSWPHAFALRVFRRLPAPIRIQAVRVIAPCHTVGALCLIEHEPDGRLLMLRQRHRNGWTFPGGLVNRGETAVQAAERELTEETGLRAELGLPMATVIDPRTRRVDVLFHLLADSAPEITASGEALRADWVDPAEAGPLDDPTRQALAALARARAPGAHRGRIR